MDGPILTRSACRRDLCGDCDFSRPEFDKGQHKGASGYLDQLPYRVIGIVSGNPRCSRRWPCWAGGWAIRESYVAKRRAIQIDRADCVAGIMGVLSPRVRGMGPKAIKAGTAYFTIRPRSRR